MVDINDINARLEKARELISGVADDLEKSIDTVQALGPMGESILKHILDRATQAKDIFTEAQNARKS